MMVTKADSQGGVRVITLNRPDRLNAIVPELVTDLLSMLTEAANDETVRAVILRGAGRAFCSGDDLQNETGTLAQTQAFVEGIQDVSRAILLGPKPVVAAVHGWAVGGGLEWVMNCDFAVCSDETRFFFPEVSLGLFPTGGATSILPRLVGLQRARELMLFGEQFDAQQAHDWGLIWNVVPEDSLLDAATMVARRIAGLPSRCVQDLRRILITEGARGVEEAMEAETLATVRAFQDPATAPRLSRWANERRGRQPG